MDEKTITEMLKKNVVEYHQTKLAMEKMEERQEELKDQNLGLVKMIGLKKGDYVVFDEVRLQIQLIEMIKSDRVDEDGLVAKYGVEKIIGLKVLPVKAVETAISTGKLPKEAGDFIIKKPPIEYTKITPVTGEFTKAVTEEKILNMPS